MWWTDSEPSPLCFALVKFPEHVTFQTGNFFMLNKSRKKKTTLLFFFLNNIKMMKRRSVCFCSNKMEMKNNPIRCTLKLSGHNQHFHHWNSVEREIFMYRR